MFTTQSASGGWFDPNGDAGGGIGDSNDIATDLDSSFGYDDASSSASANDDRPTMFSTFETEFWRSFAEDHQLFEAPQHPFDAATSDMSGLWSANFLPPPPRPPFMDGDAAVMSDGVTTCDLCSWAVQEKNAFSLEGSFEAAGELGWAFSIGLVSVVSALIGAIIMITLMRCRRLKSNSNAHMNHPHHQLHHGGVRSSGHGPIPNQYHQHQHHVPHHHNHHHMHHDHHHHNLHHLVDHERIGIGGVVGGVGIGGGGGGGFMSNGNAADDLMGVGIIDGGMHPNGVGIGGLNDSDGSGGGGGNSWWCRKSSNHNDGHHNHHQHHHDTLPKQRPPEGLPMAGITSTNASAANPQVWIWLKTVNTPPTPEPMPLFAPTCENYYTNTDDPGCCLGSPPPASCKMISNEVVYEEIAGIG